jgi:hypothetical protein
MSFARIISITKPEETLILNFPNISEALGWYNEENN